MTSFAPRQNCLREQKQQKLCRFLHLTGSTQFSWPTRWSLLFGHLCQLDNREMCVTLRPSPSTESGEKNWVTCTACHACHDNKWEKDMYQGIRKSGNQGIVNQGSGNGVMVFCNILLLPNYWLCTCCKSWWESCTPLYRVFAQPCRGGEQEQYIWKYILGWWAKILHLKIHFEVESKDNIFEITFWGGE